MTAGSVTKVVLEEEENMKRPEYPKPDTTQMLPFKPKILLGKYIIVPDKARFCVFFFSVEKY